MKNNSIFKKILAISTILIATNVAYSNGVESGGGGTTVAVNTIHLLDLNRIIESSRAELILFFNSQSSQKIETMSFNNTPEYKKLIQSPKSIFEIIEENPIYIARNPHFPCKDQNNNAVDGSIYSPKPNSICLSESRLSLKLSLGTARGQILALIAHEYSHLLGLSEEEATTLQSKIVPLIEQDSKDKIKLALNTIKYSFGSLRGAFILYDLDKNNPKSWNYLCHKSEQISNYFEDVRKIKKFNQYAFYNKVDEKTFNSFLLKSRALNNIACAKSDYHQFRKDYLQKYTQAFGTFDSISIEQWNKTNSTIAFEVDNTILLKKVKSESDFTDELNDLRNYTENEFNKIYKLQNLYLNGYITGL